MVEISLNKIRKSYGFDSLFEELNFDIKSGEKIAIVGENGTGKSTMLKMIAGIETIDSGVISYRKNCKVCFLSQNIRKISLASIDEDTPSCEKVAFIDTSCLRLKYDLLIDECSDHVPTASNSSSSQTRFTLNHLNTLLWS